jgi:hypothetical protein
MHDAMALKDQVIAAAQREVAAVMAAKADAMAGAQREVAAAVAAKDEAEARAQRKVAAKDEVMVEREARMKLEFHHELMGVKYKANVLHMRTVVEEAARVHNLQNGTELSNTAVVDEMKKDKRIRECVEKRLGPQSDQDFNLMMEQVYFFLSPEIHTYHAGWLMSSFCASYMCDNLKELVPFVECFASVYGMKYEFEGKKSE